MAHPPGYLNLDTSTGQLLGFGVNSEHGLALKLAVTYRPSDDLSVTRCSTISVPVRTTSHRFFWDRGLFPGKQFVAQPVTDSFFLASAKS